MADFNTKQLRNLALLGHGGSGKTSLAEAMLYIAGATDRLGSIAGYARYTRAELSEVLTGEFMLLARTKGLTKRQAIYRHAMRNSMVVIFPSILSEFIGVLSGSMIIERMFAIPGVGGLYLNAINYQDYDFFMLLSAFYTLIGLAAGIVIDISYGFIDPRIRMGAK